MQHKWAISRAHSFVKRRTDDVSYKLTICCLTAHTERLTAASRPRRHAPTCSPVSRIRPHMSQLDLSIRSKCTGSIKPRQCLLCTVVLCKPSQWGLNRQLPFSDPPHREATAETSQPLIKGHLRCCYRALARVALRGCLRLPSGITPEESEPVPGQKPLARCRPFPVPLRTRKEL